MTEARTGALSVLIVEDEEADFEIVKKGLQRSGIDFHCRRVDNEMDYLAQIQARPDIILSDYVLPGFGALEALRLLNESGLDIPFIVLTGTASEETVVESMKRGAADYLIKDRLTRLGSAVRRAIGERELRAEKRLAEESALRDRLLKDAAEARAEVAMELGKTHHDLHESNRRLKETEAQLIQNEKMASLGQLVAGVAHEINNPLAFVVNNLFIVESGLEGLAPELEPNLAPESFMRLTKLRTRLTEIGEGLDRVKELVLNLRTFSRMDEGEFGAADVVEIIDAVLLILKHRLNGRVHVEKRYPPERTLYCCAGRLRQVLMNLLVNASDAIGDDGTIVITASRTPTYFVIAIRDSGAGIPEAIRGRIFDPFFTTKPIGQGTGLGLAISFGIVQDHGGAIEVESKEGAGTEFRVKIPLDLEAKRQT